MPATYEAPGFRILQESDDEDDYSFESSSESEDDHSPRTPNIVYSNQLPPLSSLVGPYDLIFFCTDPGAGQGLAISGYQAQHRVLRGSLELELHSAGELQGTLSMPESVKRYLVFHSQLESDIQIRGTQDGNLQVTNLNDFVNEHFYNVTGTVKSVAEAMAVRYMPERKWQYRSGIKDWEREYALSIPPLETVEQAQSFLDSHWDSCAPLMWLCNHLGLPDGVSALVRQFATAKPPPVFFFKPGDLFLEFTWDIDNGYDGDLFSTTFVARRRNLSNLE